MCGGFCKDSKTHRRWLPLCKVHLDPKSLHARGDGASVLSSDFHESPLQSEAGNQTQCSALLPT